MDVVFLIERIKDHLNIKSDADLAKRLGVLPATLSAWKKRNTSAGSLIEAMAENKIPISFDRLLHQEGNHNIGISVNSSIGDAELQKLLQAALALSTLEELKQIIRDHIKKSAG